MKKFGLGIVALVVMGVLYYFTTGKTQLRDEMKMRVNTELSKIEAHGFGIKERNTKEKEEHFVLTVEDPVKIVAFYKQQGNAITLEDAQALSGMKIGVNLQYLKDGYSALSADLYPLTLPDALKNNKEMKEADKAFIAELNKMLERKAILVHIDFNKLLTDFKGSFKDIHENLALEKPVKIDLVGATFEGTLKDDRVNSLKQAVTSMGLQTADTLNVLLSNIKSDYSVAERSIYDTNSSYSIESFKVSGTKGQKVFSVNGKNVNGSNDTYVKQGLAGNETKLNVLNLEFANQSEKIAFIDSSFSFNLNNIDMAIIQEIEKTDANETEKIDKLVQALIAKGLVMEIPDFSVKQVQYKGETLDGFSLTSSFKINKTANISTIQNDIFTIISAIDTKTKITLSDTLFAIIAQRPEAMLLAMFIQPKQINGAKVYELELKEGKVKINGQGLF